MINIIKKYIYPFLREPKNYKPVVEHLKLDIRVQGTLEEMNNHPDYLINLKNGMFDVRNMILLEHDKKYKSINQIPWELDPEYLNNQLCDIPNFSTFLTTSTQSNDDVKMILEFMANCLSISNDSQKALLFTGLGGTGKSVLLNLIIKIVGENNTSTIPLQALSERFTTQMLQGKLLNAYADLTSEALKDTSNFKTITGQDVVKGEYKHGAVFSFRSYAKLLFSANTLPKNLDEESNAFYRRLLIAEIKRGNHIPGVNKTLADEIPKIIGLLLQIAHDLDKRHWELFESDNSKKLVKGLQKMSDSVTAFLDDRIIKLEGSRVKKLDVFRNYEMYCLDEGRRAKGKTAFYEAMRNKKISDVVYSGYDSYKDISILENAESDEEFDFIK